MPQVEEVNLVGKKQDISDLLVIANAAEMPFFTQIRKGKKPDSTLVEYPVDKYDNPRNDGVPDGKDADVFEDAQKDRELLRSRVQKWRRNPMVSEMAEDVTKQAGSGVSKFADAKAKKLVELKQDIEYTMLGNQDSRAQQSATIGAQTRGMGSWTQTTAQADTATAVPDGYRPVAGQIYSGTIGNFIEDALRALLQARYEQVKSKGDLNAFVGTLIKNAVSDMSRFEVVPNGKTLVRRFDGKKDHVLETMVEIYKGDYGIVKFFIDLFTASSLDGHIIDMNKVEFRPAKAPQFKDLPDLDGGPRGVVKAIGALANLLPPAHCKIAATN